MYQSGNNQEIGNTLKHLSLRNFMQGISYIIDQGPENSNWMWWISLENINGKKQKILRAGGSSVIWDQRKKGTGRKFNLLLDMCPIEKQKKWEEREGKGERKNEKLSFTLLSPALQVLRCPSLFGQILNWLGGLDNLPVVISTLVFQSKQRKARNKPQGNQTQSWAIR